MKFEFNWPSGFRGEDVWKCWRTDGRTTDGRTTDARVTGILIAHLGAFGSGELKNNYKRAWAASYAYGTGCTYTSLNRQMTKIMQNYPACKKIEQSFLSNARQLLFDAVRIFCWLKNFFVFPRKIKKNICLLLKITPLGLILRTKLTNNNNQWSKTWSDIHGQKKIDTKIWYLTD